MSKADTTKNIINESLPTKADVLSIIVNQHGQIFCGIGCGHLTSVIEKHTKVNLIWVPHTKMYTFPVPISPTGVCLHVCVCGCVASVPMMRDLSCVLNSGVQEDE